MVETTTPKSHEEPPAIPPYGAEERLADALKQLPTPDMVQKLVGLLKPDELREVAAGLLADCAQAARNGNLLESAEAINSWVATAEEIVTTRKRFRYIKQTREDLKSPKPKAE